MGEFLVRPGENGCIWVQGGKIGCITKKNTKIV